MKLYLHASRYTLYASRNCPLHLSRILYKSALFMQNKANDKIGKMNTSIATIKDYDNEQRTINNERYSKQTQTKPIAKAKKCCRILTTMLDMNPYRLKHRRRSLI